MTMNPVVRNVLIGVGAAAAIGTVAFLAGCAAKPQDPENTAFDVLGPFDKDGVDGISKREAVRQVIDRDYEFPGTRNYIARDPLNSNYVLYNSIVGERTWDESVMKAVTRADKNGDAIASWQELNALAKTFDNNPKDGKLDHKEQAAFKQEFRARQENFQTHGGHLQMGRVYDPSGVYFPTIPDYNNGGNHGGSWGNGNDSDWNSGGSGGTGGSDWGNGNDSDWGTTNPAPSNPGGGSDWGSDTGSGGSNWE